MIVAAQYDCHSKKRVKPTNIIKLSFDGKHRKVDIEQELIEKVLKAWQPIKAEA